jgi:hypothetical protein
VEIETHNASAPERVMSSAPRVCFRPTSFRIMRELKTSQDCRCTVLDGRRSRVDFTGKRVGIIGTGPTAVQIIQTIAPDCKELTVFSTYRELVHPAPQPADYRARATGAQRKAHEIFAPVQTDLGRVYSRTRIRERRRMCLRRSASPATRSCTTAVGSRCGWALHGLLYVTGCRG